ncbi:MAG: PIN domain-containing protein [Methanosarcinales archaeon]|jgi:predicted nucleic acid-binding protein|nr:PIN domain-containing protein [Methanosarcinales archaeon]
MNNELSLIDSNLLSYVFDKNESEKRSICKELVSDCWKGKRKCAVSVQNLSEFYVVVTKKISRPIPEAVAKKFIELIIIFKGWSVITFNASMILSAIDISTQYNIHYWDALIVAAMKENNIFCIYTEDSDFKKIPWLTVINPFEMIKNQSI